MFELRLLDTCNKKKKLLTQGPFATCNTIVLRSKEIPK